MKKVIIFYLFLLFFGHIVYAQIGIGTTTPSATLQVVGSPAIATAADGVTIPKLTGDQLAAKSTLYSNPQSGTLVYVTAAANPPSAATKTENVQSAGMYIFNGTTWVRSDDPPSPLGIDVGYILAWTAQNTPPDYLLPLSGGTFDKVDFPELIAQHSIHPIQVFASEDATTFTLKNLNNGTFLKGGALASVGTSVGFVNNNILLTQANLPTVNVTATTSSDGVHTHGLTWPDDSWAQRASPGGVNTATGGNTSVNEPMVVGDWARRATINAGDAHTHSFTTSSLNPGAQSSIDVAPLHTSITWVIKAKTTDKNNGNLVINNLSPGVGTVTTVEILDNTIIKEDFGPLVGILVLGDVKYSVRNTDHSGWVLLNGRSCASGTLSVTQQAACIAQAFPGNNLPQTSGGGQNTATYLADIDGNAATRGSIGGNVDNIWAASDLPQHTHNIDYGGIGSSGNGGHAHTINGLLRVGSGGNAYRCCGFEWSNNFAGSSIVGNHGHTYNPPNTATNGGNGLGAATVSTLNRTLDANLFVFLGI